MLHRSSYAFKKLRLYRESNCSYTCYWTLPFVTKFSLQIKPFIIHFYRRRTNTDLHTFVAVQSSVRTGWWRLLNVLTGELMLPELKGCICDLSIAYHVKCKTIPLYRLRNILRVAGVLGFQISRQSANEDGWLVSLTHRSLLPLRKYSWQSFLLEFQSKIEPQGCQKYYDIEIFPWHHRESKQRPSVL